MSDPKPSEEQFLRVFLQNEDDLRGYARALLPTWEAVDEVMQEASVVMWRKLDQLRNEDEFLPWAKVIVRFEALRARRTKMRDRHYFSDEVFELLAADEFEADADVLEKERAALGHCLGELAAAQRELVLLPYQGHGAVTKLADESGKSANGLYKKIGRLREKVSKCVECQLGQTLEGMA